MSNMDTTNKGRRVELIHTDDPYTNLKPGAEGTYEMALLNPGFVQHCIKWDNGSSLILISGNDSFRFQDEMIVTKVKEGFATSAIPKKTK